MGDSGTITLENGILTYTNEPNGSWSTPLDEIGIIAEATNENGPFGDDYFLIFVSNKSPSWFEASFYASNREEFLKTLSSHFGTLFELKLTTSATFASRILWPPELKGEPLFEYKKAGLFKNRPEIRSDLLT